MYYRAVSSQPPLLRDIFLHDPDAEPLLTTLGTLATSLSSTVSALEPLLCAGYIVARSSPPYSSLTQIEQPPAAAITWLRSWLQPAVAKPLFTLRDAADLLEVAPREALAMAADYDIPLTHDEALGHLLSVWGMRKLLVSSLRGKPEADDAARFDRLAVIHWLVGDPSRVTRPPRFDEQLEQEISRVAALPEPTRSLRAAALIDQFRDARVVAEAAGVEVSQQQVELLEEAQERLIG